VTPTSDGPRSDLELARQQLEAIDRWHEARRAASEHAATTAASREARMDVARRLDVIRAEHRAIVERTDAHLRRTVEILHRHAPVRALVAHRNEWFADVLCAALARSEVDVVARLTNGAEAVEAAVAEQPDLLVVEDSLPMVTGEDVVKDVRTFSPGTWVGAQVAHDDRIATLLDAGAHTAWTRRVPPADVAADLLRLLDRTRA
jgi:CheY-like chemotaxis protein